MLTFIEIELNLTYFNFLTGENATFVRRAAFNELHFVSISVTKLCCRIAAASNLCGNKGLIDSIKT